MTNSMKHQTAINIIIYAIFFWGLLVASFFTESEVFRGAAVTVATLTFVITQARNTIILVIKEKN